LAYGADQDDGKSRKRIGNMANLMAALRNVTLREGGAQAA
jgi:hypothetical protein